MDPAVLITRPEHQALDLADRLRARWGCGVEIEISPLMRIEYLDDVPDLSGIGALIFTSRHGVDALARLTPHRDLPCFVVGPSTAAHARALGFTIRATAPDAEALLSQIRADPPEGMLLHLRGEHVAAELAGQLRTVGVAARDAVLYRQEACALSEMAGMLLARERPVLLPLYSPRSARLFFAGARVRAPLFVAAISRNVADEVPPEGAQALLVADRPDGPSMLDALDRLRADAKLLEGAKRAQ